MPGQTRIRRTARYLLLIGLLGPALSSSLLATEPEGTTQAPAQPLTLKDCYALALKQSETIAIRQELLKETEGRFLQALSGILPRVSFSSSDKRQDGSGSSAFTLRNVPERKFVFSQPLFSGFKEFAALAGSRAERRQRTDEKTRAEHLLFTDVVDVFYFLRQHRQTLQALETTRLALSERIDELRQREQLGRTRRSEVASAKVQLRRVEAGLEDLRSQETIARQLLEFLTGLPHLEAIAEADSTTLELQDEDTYAEQSVSRPDVRAAEEAWHVAQRQVTIARAKFWPTVDAEANYYTKRAGVAQDVDWDAALKVNIPLFQGGQTVGAVKEASARARQEALRFQEAKRRAALDARKAYAELQAAARKRDALEKALQAAEESYHLQVEDYRLSLVNNLDVLQALQALEEVRRDFIEADAQVKQRYWHLRVAVGQTL